MIFKRSWTSPLATRYTDRYTLQVVQNEWHVYVANEVHDWLTALDAATHTRVVQAVEQRYERYLKERTQEEEQR